MPNKIPKLPPDMRRGHFMDMVSPSSDTTLQDKPNFAADRQAELKRKLDKTKVDAVEKSSVVISEKISYKSIEQDSLVSKKVNQPANKTSISKRDDLFGIRSATARSMARRVPQVNTANRKVATVNRPPATPRPDIMPARRVIDDVRPGKLDYLAKDIVEQPKPIQPDEIEKEYDTPFIPGVVVDKKPLGSARPSGASDSGEKDTKQDKADIKSRHHFLKKKKSDKSAKPLNRKKLKLVSWLMVLLFVAICGILVAFYNYYNGFQ